MENAQGTVTSHNNFDNFLLGEGGASNSFNNALTGGTYTANPSPISSRRRLLIRALGTTKSLDCSIDSRTVCFLAPRQWPQ